MSIFTKDCPICAASHPAHAVRCRCGYCFDPNKVDGITQELEVIAQEERLYSEYLKARADQAQKDLREAKNIAAHEPLNNVKKAEALRAEQAASAARAELDAQQARAHAVSTRIKVVRSKRHTRKQVASPPPAAASLRVSVRTALTSSALLAPTPPVAPRSTPTVPPPVTTRPVPPLKMVRPAPVVARPAPAPIPPTPVTPWRPPVAPSIAKPEIARDPTPDFRASQSTKAAQIAAPRKPATQECPNCMAQLPANAKRCRCGFEMPMSASLMPGQPMSPEDRAAFLAALNPLRPARSR